MLKTIAATVLFATTQSVERIHPLHPSIHPSTTPTSLQAHIPSDARASVKAAVRRMLNESHIDHLGIIGQDFVCWAPIALKDGRACATSSFNPLHRIDGEYLID